MLVIGETRTRRAHSPRPAGVELRPAAPEMSRGARTAGSEADLRVHRAGADPALRPRPASRSRAARRSELMMFQPSAQYERRSTSTLWSTHLAGEPGRRGASSRRSCRGRCRPWRRRPSWPLSLGRAGPGRRRPPGSPARRARAATVFADILVDVAEQRVQAGHRLRGCDGDDLVLERMGRGSARLSFSQSSRPDRRRGAVVKGRAA